LSTLPCPATKYKYSGAGGVVDVELYDPQGAVHRVASHLRPLVTNGRRRC